MIKLKSFGLGPNAGAQIISLILAIILWLYAVGEQSVDVTLRVPLQVFPPAGGRMAVLNSSLQDITLRLSVSRNLLSMVSHQSVKAIHRIKGVEKAGEYNFRIEPRDITLPPGNIRILGMYPEAVTVTLDEVIVQKFPIQVDLAGDPAQGYSVDKEGIRLEPDAALVEGPKGKLSKQKIVLTEIVNVVGRTQSFRKKLRLVLDSDLKSIPKELIVDVLIPIRRQYAVNVFRGIPVKILGTTAKLVNFASVEPEKTDVTLRGPGSALEQISMEEIVAFVDISGLEKGEYEVPLKFKLPKEIALDQDPPVVKVKIK